MDQIVEQDQVLVAPSLDNPCSTTRLVPHKTKPGSMSLTRKANLIRTNVRCASKDETILNVRDK